MEKKIDTLTYSFEILSQQHVELLNILKSHSERIEYLESVILQLLVIENINPNKFKGA